MQGGLGVTDIFSKKGNGLKHQTINLSGFLTLLFYFLNLKEARWTLT